MPIIDGVILGRGTMEGAERSLQEAMRKHGAAAVRAYQRAMSLNLETDAYARNIILEMMHDADPGQFLMDVFGDDHNPDMPHDAELLRAIRIGRV